MSIVAASTSKDVRLEGYLSKLPTWTVGSSAGKEDLYRLRYFVLRERLEYYRSREHFEKGTAPRGTLDISNAILRRETRLEFTITNSKKRLSVRAMSEPLALQWLAVLMAAGARAATA
jgi:hypothetical protein